LDLECITRDAATNLVLRECNVEHYSFRDVETEAALLRHAASHRCPVTPRELLNDVVTSVEWLVPEHGVLRETLADVLRKLVASGDLIEGNVTDETGTRRTLFLGPPTFVKASNDVFFLVGTRPDGLPLLDDELTARVEHRASLRLIQAEHDEELESAFGDQGLRELSIDAWIAAPRRESSIELVRRYVDRLSPMDVGALETFRILDASRPVTFYKGRWRELLAADRGLFVGRREQAYGADLWCCLEVIGDFEGRFVDLPALDLELTGADEAWRLQAALDARRGAPQLLRLAASGNEEDTNLLFFAPLPGWAQRRLGAIGQPVVPTEGGLMGYAVATDAVAAEVAFFGDTMWIQNVGQGPVR
jgi:hypothetical protein